MNGKNYLIILLLFISFHSVFGQNIKDEVALDTVFVGNKKKMNEITKIRYYYFPNLEAYFDTQEAVYICKINGKWVNVMQIPPNYRGYSLKNGIYVILKGYIGDEPYKHLEEHKLEFPADYSAKRKPTKVIVNKNP
jgi:hypothetical protein